MDQCLRHCVADQKVGSSSPGAVRTATGALL